MRVGATIFNQNALDWDRYEAEERGEPVSSRPERLDSEIFKEELEIARIADESGFDSVWTVEHHFTPYTMVTNPLQYLTYIAGITENVDLGTMVTVLPWHNPVRVAEDTVMLDAFLGEGREVILGCGRGLARREYAGLNIDQEEARGKYDESIVILKQLLTTGECSFDGKFYQLDNVRLRPQVERDISHYLWAAGGTPESVSIIAKHDVRQLIIPTNSLEISLQTARSYLSQRAEAGHGTSAYSRLALWTYVDDSQERAQEIAATYMPENSDTATRHYELAGDHLKDVKGYERYAAVQEQNRKDPELSRSQKYLSHPWGTPDRVIDRITELAETFGTEEITFVFKYGSMSMDTARNSMNLFAKEVLPALKELSPRPMELASI